MDAAHVPGDLVASGASAKSVTLTWSASNDNVRVATYGVYGNGVLIRQSTVRSIALSGFSCGSTYRFQVDARDTASNVSRKAELTIATLACATGVDGGGVPGGGVDALPPSTPLGVAVSAASQTSVAISWSSAGDNVAVAGYGLYRDEIEVGSSTLTAYAFSGLSCATTYVLAIEAFDAAGNRSQRSAFSASTAACGAGGDGLAPSNPTGLVLTATTSTSVSLSWAASFDDVGVAGYGHYRNGAAVGSGSGLSATIGGLSCGSTYTFEIDAYDAAGNRSNRSSLLASTSACPPPSDGLAPSVPGGLVAGSVSGSSVSLSWDASTDNVGVAGYGVYSGGSLLGSTASRSYSVSGLACGTSYAFAVDAYDAAGNRSGKATRSVETSACTPPPPPLRVVRGCICPRAVRIRARVRRRRRARSFDRAYDLAQPGQTVQVAGGYYDCGSVTGSKSADVTFQAAPGVSATTTCEMAVSATHVVFRDLDLAGLRLGGSARYVTLRNVDVTCEDRAPFRLYGSKCSAGLFIAGPASDFAMYGGSVGPTWDSDVDGSPGNSQIGIPYGGGPAK